MKIIITIGSILLATTLQAAETLSLADCIELALASNPSLQKSEFALKQSEISVGQARSELFPNISASASTSNSGPVVSKMASEWDWSVGGSINQQFYRPGMYSGIGLAKARLASAEHSNESLEDQIRTNVARLYFQILASDTLVGVYQANIRLSDEQTDKMRQLVDLGLRRKSDLLKAEVQRGNFESQLIRETESLASSKRAMNILLGRNPNTEFDVEQLDVEQIDVPELQTAISILQENSPEIKRLEAQLKQEKISLSIAREAYLPSLSGSYSYSQRNDALGGSAIESDAVSLRLSIDLFDGFNRRNNLQINKLNLSDAEVEYAATLRDLDESLSNQYESLETQNQLIRIHQTNLASAREDLAVVSEQYANGLSTILDLTDAQVSVLESETNLLRDLYTRKQIEAEIRRLIGQ